MSGNYLVDILFPNHSTCQLYPEFVCAKVVVLFFGLADFLAGADVDADLL